MSQLNTSVSPNLPDAGAFAQFQNSAPTAAPDGQGAGIVASRAPDAGTLGVSHPPVGSSPAPAQQPPSSLNDAFAQAANMSQIDFAQHNTAPAPQPNGQAPAPQAPPVAPSTPVLDAFKAAGFQIDGVNSDSDLISALAQMTTEHQALINQQMQQAQVQQQPGFPPEQPPVSQPPAPPTQQAGPQHGEANALGQRFNAEWQNQTRWNAEAGAFEAIHPRFTAAAEAINAWYDGYRNFQRRIYEDPASVINPLIEQRIEQIVKPLQDEIAQYKQQMAQQATEDLLLQYPDLTAADAQNPHLRTITQKGMVFKQALESIPSGALPEAERQQFAYFKAQQWEASQQQVRPVIAPPRPQPQTPIGQAMQQFVPQQPAAQQPAQPQTFNVRQTWEQQVMAGAQNGNGINGFGGGAGNLGPTLARQTISPTPRANSPEQAFQLAVQQAQEQGLLSL